jgi:FHA domain
MALILEVLGTRGSRVRARLRIDALPVRIGRGLDNDLILDDPYIDAQHARITRDAAGELLVEDLGSLNGVMLGRGTERVARVVASPGTELRMGRTVLRFRDPMEPVPPAVRDTEHAARGAPSWATKSWGQVALCVVTIAAFGASGWLGSFDRSAAPDTFTMAVGVGLVGVVWSGIWSVVGRIGVQRFRFLNHLTLFSLVVLLLLGWGTIAEWAGFLFPDSGWTDVLGTIIGGLLIAVLVAGHLGLASALSARRRWVAGAVTSLLILSLAGVDALTEGNAFSDVPVFAGTVKAVGGDWLPTHSVAQFNELTAELMDEVDTMVK